MIHECGLTETNGHPHRYRHERLAHCWVIGLGIRGKGRRRMDGYDVEYTTPSISCSRPGLVYEVMSLPPHDNSSIYLLAALGDDWRPCDIPEVAPGYYRKPLAGHPYLAEITEAFRDMYRWTRTFVPHAEGLALNSMQRGLLLASAHTPQPNATRDDRLHGITGYIFMHMASPLDVESLAAEVGMSPSRFAHLFTSTYGIAPMRYVERVRMEEAKALLNTGTATVKDIAHRVGYPNEFYFSRRFKQATGTSPSAYRGLRTDD